MSVGRSENVITVTANNDTIAGPLIIREILYVPGSGSPNASIAVGGVTIWSAAQSSSRIMDQMRIHIGGGATATVSMAGTGTVLYIYTE